MQNPPISVGSAYPDRAVGGKVKYYGVYRGQVKERDDQETDNPKLGRIKVWIPQVHGEEYEDRVDDLPWAWPIFLLAGKDSASFGSFCIPPDDTWVYVLFEAGDLTRPLWLGGWYGEDELPEALVSDGRSSARYPDVIGWVSPYEGKIIWRVLGNAKGHKDERWEVVYGDPGAPDAIIEFDSVGYGPNDEPTLRIQTSGWNIHIEAVDKDIKIKTNKKLQIECEELEILVEKDLDIQAGGNGYYYAFKRNKFAAGDKILGSAPAAEGFETRDI